MGVPGLSTFIDSNNHLLQDIKLHDKTLIIDGNNLLHHIYYRYHIDVFHGGEYLELYNCCKHFFEQLTRCNIKMIVIFDGAYEQDGRRFKTQLKKKIQRIKDHDAIAKGYTVYSQILPIFASNVFITVLSHLGIQKFTCLTEADQNIASLAKEMNCPILSNDSDFFIYDIPAGVILIDYLNLNIIEEDSFSYLNVPLYQVNDFTKWAKLKDGDLSLFATLLGNDLIDSSIFDQFFARKKCMFEKKSDKIKGLLKWLSSKKTTESAISDILSCIPFEKQEKVKNIILQSIDEYGHPAKTYAIAHILNKHTFESCDCMQMFLSRVPYITKPLAFLFINGEASSSLLELMTNFRNVERPQVEQIRDVSTSQCSQPLRRLVYGHIVSSMSDKNQLFLEYKRSLLIFVKEILRPLFFNPAGSSIPSFDEILKMNETDKQTYLVECLIGRIINNCSLYDSFLFYASVVCYWQKHTQLDTFLLQALILFLFSQFSSNIINNSDMLLNKETMNSDGRDTNITSSNYAYLNDSFSESNLDDEYINNNKWNDFVRISPYEIKDRKQFAYKFSQFQSCLKEAHKLNIILLKPFSYVFCIDGSKLFSIYQYLSHYKAAGLDDILKSFKDIRQLVLQAMEFIQIHSFTKEINVSNENKTITNIKG